MTNVSLRLRHYIYTGYTGYNKGITFTLEGLLVFPPDSVDLRPERSEGRKSALKGGNINNHDKLNVIRIIVKF